MVTKETLEALAAEELVALHNIIVEKTMSSEVAKDFIIWKMSEIENILELHHVKPLELLQYIDNGAGKKWYTGVTFNLKSDYFMFNSKEKSLFSFVGRDKITLHDCCDIDMILEYLNNNKN